MAGVFVYLIQRHTVLEHTTFFCAKTCGAGGKLFEEKMLILTI
jgi:hypothetical protein